MRRVATALIGALPDQVLRANLEASAAVLDLALVSFLDNKASRVVSSASTQELVEVVNRGLTDELPPLPSSHNGTVTGVDEHQQQPCEGFWRSSKALCDVRCL